MKTPLISISITMTMILFLSSCALKNDDNLRPIAKHVVVIGIDGLSPDGIVKADTPVLENMINNGAHAFHTRSVMPSSSGANWSSMVMGAGPEQHGVFSNNWRTDNLTLPPIVTRDDNHFPSIFAVLRDQHPHLQIGAILHWNPISNYIEKDVLDYMALPGNEDETTALASAYITEQKPNFTFIHIDHVDGAGHRYGHGSPEYYISVTKADSLIGVIVQATKDAGMFDETVFIISSDHGGLGTGHGGNTLAEMEIPFIVFGKNVKPNHKIGVPVNVYDVPATVLFTLGVEQPYEWISRPVKSVFEGYAEPKLMYKLNSLVAPPMISPAGEGAPNPAGGLFINDYPEVTMSNPNDTGKIHYTLDGSMPIADSPLYLESFIISSNTIVNARLFDGNTPISNVKSGYFRIIEDSTGHGLNYEVYQIDESEMLPDFSKLRPSGTGTTLEISSNSLDLPRIENVAAVLHGFIRIPEDGRYTFHLASDDGSKMYINNQLLIDNDGNHGVVIKSSSITLTKGNHAIKTEWFNGGGGYWLAAMIEGPNLPAQIIPPSMLFRAE